MHRDKTLMPTTHAQLTRSQCRQLLNALALLDQSGTVPNPEQTGLLQQAIGSDWHQAWQQLEKPLLRAKCQATPATAAPQFDWQPLLNNCGATIRFYCGTLDTALGPIWLAATEHGIHQLHFLSPDNKAKPLNTQANALLAQLQQQWPRASFIKNRTALASYSDVFSTGQQSRVILQPSGSDFELKVWRALLSVTAGHVASYAGIAALIGQPKASRAVGRAIARNAIAGLIPCHRVVKANGESGQYRWGISRKRWLLAREIAAQSSK